MDKVGAYLQVRRTAVVVNANDEPFGFLNITGARCQNPDGPKTKITLRFGNCSTRVEEGAYGRKCSLDRLKSGQAMAFAGIHD